MWIRIPNADPDPGVESEEKNKSLTSIFFLFRRNRNRKNALPIIQEIKLIIFKSEPKKEDIIADILLMKVSF